MARRQLKGEEEIRRMPLSILVDTELIIYALMKRFRNNWDCLT